MELKQFENMAVTAIKLALAPIVQNEKFSIVFGKVETEFSCSSDKISGTVLVTFSDGQDEYQHSMLVCWRSGWGLSLEHEGKLQAITFTNILQRMYFQLATSNQSTNKQTLEQVA